MKNYNKLTQIIIHNHHEFLKFYKSKFSAFHNSNIFLRDIHFSILKFLNEKGIKVKYSSVEKIVDEITKTFEKQNIFKKIDNRTWMLNYPEFLTPRVTRK